MSMNHDNVRRMISNDQIFSLKTEELHSTFTICCWMSLLKLGSLECTLFFFTCSAAKFHWAEVIQVVGCQYGQALTDEQINAMDWSTKVHYLKRNLVTVARQSDYVFKQLWGKVISSVMHTIGQIWNLATKESSKVEALNICMPKFM